MEPVSKGNENREQEVVVASEGGQSASSSSGPSKSSSSSSPEFEEGITSPLPNKRSRTSARNRKYKSKPVRTDPRIDTLMSQMSYVSNYLNQYPVYCFNSDKVLPSSTITSTQNFDRTGESGSGQFITLPAQPESLSQFGFFNYQY